MNRIFTSVCAFVMSVAYVAAADVTPRDNYPTYAAKQPVGHVSVTHQPVAGTAAADVAHRWVDLGSFDYTDDILTSFFSSLTPVTYKVRVQSDESNPGFYRIVDPWTSHPQRDAVINDPYSPGTLGSGDDCYILIDARDPEYVRLLESPIKVDDGYGEATLYGRTELVGEPVDFYPLTQAEADICAGRMKDNVITFTKERSFAAKQDGSYYPANGDGAFKLDLNGAPAPADDRKWVDLGLCDYVDDIATAFFDVSPTRFKVSVQADEAHPGFYRIVDPWAGYPHRKALEDAGASFGSGNEYYILIDATDPDYVRIPESPLGMDDGDGPTTVQSLTELVGVKLGNDPVSQEKADMAAGRLADNVITFVANPALILLQDGTYYPANRNYSFALALPGGKLKTDYSISVEVEEGLCPDADGNYHVTVMGDNTIESVRYAVLAELPEKVTDDFTAISNECAVGEPFVINVNDGSAATLYALFASYNEAGEPQASTFVTLSNPAAGKEGWEYFGKADMTEGFISCVFPDIASVETYEVDIERRSDNHNILRIVNPYTGSWSGAQAYGIDYHGHDHYIYINAENENNVYVDYSPVGVYIPDNGECAISSDYIDMIKSYGLGFLEMFEIYSGGSIKDHVLTFDNSCDIKLLPVRYGKWIYTNRFNNPDYDPDTMTGTYDMYLPGNFRLDMTKAYSGIEDITVDGDNAGEEYFNLQGIKIDRPAHGVYIVRKANRSVKVVR